MRREDHLMIGLGVSLEKVMDLACDCARKGGKPIEVHIGMPNVSFYGPTGRLEIHIREDLAEGQVEIV